MYYTLIRGWSHFEQIFGVVTVLTPVGSLPTSGESVVCVSVVLCTSPSQS